MKDVELRLFAELIKNSRRSDRELARELGTSQPTITRIRSKLEKEGKIREYTMIPDYVSLGFQMMSITFFTLTQPLSGETLENARKINREMMKKNPTANILAMNGMGCEADRVVIALHRDYSEYVEFVRMTKQHPAVSAEHLKSFIIDLLDTSSFQPLSFFQLANYLLTTKGKPPDKK